LDEVLKLVRESGKAWVALIQKTDLNMPHRVAILRQKLSDDKVPVIEGSALEGGKVLKELILEHVMPLMPAAEKPLYDEELYTLSTTRELCAEVVREKCFEELHQEIPFGLAVRIVKYTEDEGPLVTIIAEILVAKDNHRAIVIGKGGANLKKIGTDSRKEMEKIIGRRIYLDLNVATKKNWQKNPGMMKDLGYVVPTA
jgi:GTP-binding protein Era